MTASLSLGGSTRSTEARLAELIDALTARLQGGEALDAAALLRDHPEHAERLEQLLPALRMLAEASHASAQGAPAGALDDKRLLGELGDFRLVREIGRGGMGVVYEAEQISLSRRVALKVLPFASTLDSKQLQRFKNEAQAAAGLHHTNIVPVYATGCERGVHYYAMQFIEGQTLAAVIAELRVNVEGRRTNDKSQKTTPYCPQAGAGTEIRHSTLGFLSSLGIRHSSFFRTVAQLGVQAAEALEHAHQLGVIHRDIKPANLLIDYSTLTTNHSIRLWITDFGLAHCQSQAGLTMTGDLVGTLRYMSPEQALAKRVLVDHRTDVYSLGVTLYELLVREPAFTGNDREELLRQITFEEPKTPRRINKAIPRELETIVLKAMEKNPGDRYATAQELADDLEHFLKDEPIRAKRATVVHKVKKWSRRNKGVVRTGMAFLALLAAGLAGLVLWRLHESEERAAEIQQALDRLSAANELIQTGRFHADVGQWARAQKDFSRAVDLRPDHSLVWFERGDFYNRLGLWDRAAADYAEAFRLQQPATPRQWFSHAVLSAYAGDWEGYRQACVSMPQRLTEETYFGSENELVRACTLAPSPGLDLTWAKRLGEQALAGQTGRTAHNYHALGLVHYRAGEYAEAVQTIKASLKLDPNWPNPVPGCLNPLVLAMAHHRLGQAGEAQKALDRAAEGMEHAIDSLVSARTVAFPQQWLDWLQGLILYREAKTLIDGIPPRDEPRLLAVRGRALAALQEASEAEEACGRARQLGPNDAQLLLACFLIYGDLGEWDRASLEHAQLVKLRPQEFQRELEHFRYHVLRGNWDQAHAEYGKVFQERPKESALRIAAGHLYFQEGQWDRALVGYQEALGFKPAPDRLPSEVTAALREKGILAKAISAYHKVNRFSPNRARIHVKLAWALEHKGMSDEALAEYSLTVKLDPKDAPGWVNRGRAYWNLHQYDKAIPDYSKAIELEPGHEALCGRGATYVQLHQYDKALADLNRALELDPNCAYALTNRGWTFHEIHQYDKALADFNKALDLDPKMYLAWNDRGLTYFYFHQYDKATADHREAIRLKPEESWPYYFLGNALNAQGKLKDAVRAWGEATRRKPDIAAAHSNLGAALAAQGRHKEAEAALRKAIDLKPDDPVAYVNLGAALNDQGKHKEAEAASHEAIALKPDFATAHYSLGNALQSQRRYQEAEAAYRQAIRLQHDYPDAHYNLGTALHDQRRYAEAEAAYRQAIALKPEFATAYCNLANTLSAQGKHKEAEAICRQAIALQPSLARAHHILGIVLHDRLRRYPEAEKAFREAIRLKPDDPVVHCNLGTALNSQGKYKEAEACFHEAIRLNPNDPVAHGKLGVALAAQARYQEAEPVFRKAIALNPDDAQTQYSLGNALSGRGKHKEAEAAYRAAIHLTPNYPEAHFNLGSALNRQGKLGEAEAEYREALRLRPDDPVAHYGLGGALRDQGKLREAEVEYREALRLRPDYPEAHSNLGQVLRPQGRFAESLAAYKRGHELGSKQPSWRYPSAEWVRQAEQLVALDAKLANIIKGKAQPADAAERIGLAKLCQEYKKLYAAAARFYAEAFTQDPKLADDLRTHDRYNAARAAALAGCGQGEDTAKLDHNERSQLRKQALDWLRADLAAWRKVLEEEGDKTRATVQQTLRRWQQETDFAGIRGDGLAKLSEAERPQWHELWDDVEALRRRAAEVK